MTNSAAIGYALMTLKRMKEIGFPIDDFMMREFESFMTSNMDFHTEEEAEEVYRNT